MRAPVQGVYVLAQVAGEHGRLLRHNAKLIAECIQVSQERIVVAQYDGAVAGLDEAEERNCRRGKEKRGERGRKRGERGKERGREGERGGNG